MTFTLSQKLLSNGASDPSAIDLATNGASYILETLGNNNTEIVIILQGDIPFLTWLDIQTFLDIAGQSYTTKRAALVFDS